MRATFFSKSYRYKFCCLFSKNNGTIFGLKNTSEDCVDITKNMIFTF